MRRRFKFRESGERFLPSLLIPSSPAERALVKTCLLAVQAMARREREQLHERLGLAQPPPALRHRKIVDLHGEATEEMNMHPGRGTGS